MTRDQAKQILWDLIESLGGQYHLPELTQLRLQIVAADYAHAAALEAIDAMADEIRGSQAKQVTESTESGFLTGQELVARYRAAEAEPPETKPPEPKS